MFQEPEYFHNISLKMSRVLEEIGVNKKIISLRRKHSLFKETLRTVFYKLEGAKVSCYNFGSRAEGTTTPGLDSDFDRLYCSNYWKVIGDLRDWDSGVYNLLMIQDETTPPGYCMLQRLNTDGPSALKEVPDIHHVYFMPDKVLMKNNYFEQKVDLSRSGPAFVNEEEESDNVFAFPCGLLPQDRKWLNKPLIQGFLSADMKRYIDTHDCYVVPVGNTNSENEELEWRLSTSHAERCLMHNINLTQMQTYVLLKMILKTFLTFPGEKSLSSFMCKNVLLRCILQTDPGGWERHKLLTCCNSVLRKLLTCVSNEHCPHFIINENNLMKCKFSKQAKYFLIERLKYLLSTNGAAFLDISIDDFGRRLLAKCSLVVGSFEPADVVCAHVAGELAYDSAIIINGTVNSIFTHSSTIHANGMNRYIDTLALYRKGDNLERTVGDALTPFLYSTLGGILASQSIYINKTVSMETLNNLTAGNNSDVASGKLKLATVYYSVGAWNQGLNVLIETEEMYVPHLVTAVCDCTYRHIASSHDDFDHYIYTHDFLAFVNVTAQCVKFLPCELYCLPEEMLFEKHRSTKTDIQDSGPDDCWMDWAVVDSLPYLYFLKYKIYGRLLRRGEQVHALAEMASCIHTTRNIGHKETALNLLGQCMKQEKMYREALQCFTRSLIVRPRNNAARLHVCLLLYLHYRARTQQR